MVTFVCGMPCVGKSTYIKKHFPNAEIIDIYNYQNKNGFCFVNDCFNWYEQAKVDLVEKALQTDVVVEHTLLKKNRRLEQIENLRNNGYTGEIHLVFINPDVETHKERLLQRKFKDYELDDFRNMHIDIMELPSDDDNEGFDSILIIKE